MTYNLNQTINYMITEYCGMCKKFNYKIYMSVCKICNDYCCNDCYIDSNICKCIDSDYVCKICKDNYSNYKETWFCEDNIACYPCDICYEYFCKECMLTELYCKECCKML